MAAVRYKSRYPRQGQVAILCEGDIAGYEVDLLEKWLSLQELFVDVWPCGTKSAISGVSDAIGRAIPIVVIEDRDFRTPEQAKNACLRNERDRQKRAVRLHAWKCWNRHEIENYFLESVILLPVLATAFNTTEQEVAIRLRRLLCAIAVDQAAQWALSQFWVTLPDRTLFVPGLPRKTARPYWSKENCAIESPPNAKVRDALHATLMEHQKSFMEKAGKNCVDTVVSAYDQKLAEWTNPDPDSSIWKSEWGGKEILTMLCRWLAGELGWQTDDTAQRTAIDWAELTASKKDAEMDREISNELQPHFVNALHQFLASTTEHEIPIEWAQLTGTVREAVSSSI